MEAWGRDREMTGKLREGILWDVKATLYYRARPGKPFACFFTGWAGLMRGREKAADRYFDEALSLDPNYTPALIGKIAVCIRRGRFREAQLLLEKELYKFHRQIDFFRLSSAISLSAALPLFDQERKTGIQGGGISLRQTLAGLFADFGSNSREMEWNERYINEKGQCLVKYLSLIRFIKSLSKKKASIVYQRTLALHCYDLPGLSDSLRILLIRAICGDRPAAHPDWDSCDRAALSAALNTTAKLFLLDKSADIPDAFVDSIFQHAIMGGKMERARILLDNYYPEDRTVPIHIKNKWWYLYQSRKRNLRGKEITRIAYELHEAGWWADPLVKLCLAQSGSSE